MEEQLLNWSELPNICPLVVPGIACWLVAWIYRISRRNAKLTRDNYGDMVAVMKEQLEQRGKIIEQKDKLLEQKDRLLEQKDTLLKQNEAALIRERYLRRMNRDSRVKRELVGQFDD